MKSLLYSRKFWLTVWALVQTIVGHYVQLPTDIILAIDALVLFLIGSIAYEDAAVAKAQANADALLISSGADVIIEDPDHKQQSAG